MKNLLILFVGLLFIACGGSNSFETSNGVVVNYIKQGDGLTVSDSLIGLYYISFKTEDGKWLAEAELDNPSPLKVDPANAPQQGDLYEVISMLKSGDSIEFKITASELYAKSFGIPLPDSINADSKITFYISLIDQLTEDGYYQMVQEKTIREGEKQLVIDNGILDEYMANNNINPETTESGLRYVITQEGNGPKPENGQVVQVNYAGWILDGPYFDTSVESVAREQGLYQEGRPYQPFSFQLGQGRVIRGWDEGIALLNVGSKATLYIPSPLGYGNRGTGPIIQPNSILVFDVELVGIQ